MKKIAATLTVVVALLLGTLSATPAHADETAPPTQAIAAAAGCDPNREALLGYTIDALQETTEVMNRDLVRAERAVARKDRRIERQAATIRELREQIQALR